MHLSYRVMIISFFPLEVNSYSMLEILVSYVLDIKSKLQTKASMARVAQAGLHSDLMSVHSFLPSL